MSKQFIEVINKIKQKNGLDFKLIDGVDIEGILDAPVVSGSEPDTTEMTLGEYIQGVADSIDADIEEHLKNKNNPHEVKASQLDDVNTAFNKNFEESANNIQMAGTASVGTLDTIARADHVHPIDTSRAAQSEVNGISQTLEGLQTTVNEHINTTYKEHIDAYTQFLNTYNVHIEEAAATKASFETKFTTDGQNIAANKKAIEDLGKVVEALNSEEDTDHLLQQQELDGLVTRLTFTTKNSNTDVNLTFCAKEEDTITIDWGDGSIVEYLFNDSSDEVSAVSHEYSTIGSYDCKIYNMKYLCPTFLTNSDLENNDVSALITALSLNKKLNLTKAISKNVFTSCPQGVKIIVPFDELTAYNSNQIGGNIDAVAHVSEIKTWVKAYIDNMLVTSLSEITNKN